MANRPVLGGAPVAFVDTSGKQIEIPLSLLQFGPAGIDASNWPGYASYKSQVDPLFALLASGNLLRPGDAPTASPALQIAARDPGSSGNQITISFANVVPNKANPDQTKVDATVAVTQSLAGLTMAGIGQKLGTPTGGTQPGLVVLTAAAVALPAEGEADLAGSPASWAVPKDGGGGDAFTLQTAHDAADATKIHARVTQLDATAGTFTLTVSWTKSAPGVELKDLGATFAFVITVTAPPSGFAPPVAGTVTLQGGADASSSSAAGAKATVLSG